jgi:hypothetical protein
VVRRVRRAVDMAELANGLGQVSECHDVQDDCSWKDEQTGGMI